MAAEIDTPEDCLKELLANAARRWRGDLPRTLMEFRMVIQLVALEALKQAISEGSLAGLFDGLEPTMTERETCALMLAEIIHDSKPGLQAKCIDFVMQLGIADEKTETQIAASEHVGKAAVSKRCVDLRKTFGLPEVQGMKTDAARESYRKRQTGKRARPPREAWAFTGMLREVFTPLPHAA